MKLLCPELQKNHLIERSFPLHPAIIKALHQKNWPLLDQLFLEATQPQGALFHFLQDYLDFTSIEHIIAIREAPNDEEGIWHDDGSRILGFSLSLTEKYQEIEGGELRFRSKGTQDFLSLTTRPLGRILLFKTGVYGFEHMVSAVTKGQRIVLAGWCSP